MKVLVTGATGFVGSHLVDQLLAHGDQVRALARDETKAAALRAQGAEIFLGNMSDEASLVRACEGVEVVYHAAARVEIVGTEEEFHETTVLGTKRLVDAAKAAGSRRFVMVSSCGVYHPRLLTVDATIDEFTPTLVPPRWFLYGRAKLEAEEIVRNRSGPVMEWTIVRLGAIYGPRNRAMRTYIEPAMRDGSIAIIGDGKNPLALVYVVDTAEALMRAGHEAGAAGQILIAGPSERVTQQQYMDAMADGFGLPRVTRHVPYSVAFAFTTLSEYFLRNSPRASILCRAGVAVMGLSQNIQCTHSQKVLNWSARTKFTDGMREAFAWYHAAK